MLAWIAMAEAARNDLYTVSCPHCKREFEQQLLDGPAERYRGFKCPHCRLFVPLERAGDQDPDDAS